MSNFGIRGLVKAGGLLIFFMMLATIGQATHLRAGEIIVERLNCSSLTFRITINAYTNTGSEILFGEGILDFGDGSEPHITEQTANTPRPDLGPNIGTVTYSIDHVYSGARRYTISYLEPNRNGGILNIFNSIETKFYIETVITIDPFLGCNNTPKLLVPPIDKACTGAAWYHNPGAYDPDGDSLSYEMTIPKREKSQVVNDYRVPNDKEFYDRAGLNYGSSNEDGTAAPTFTIDAKTGTIVWDAPGAFGEYNIAFLIKEWRKVNGIWVLMGYVERDMQIIVDDCSNQRPELIVPEDICVEAGDEVIQDIFAFDPDSDSVKIEAFSQVFQMDPNSAVMVPAVARFQRSSPSSHARVTFRWLTSCVQVKEQSYQIVFKVTDKSNNGPGLVQFKTWNIRVVGPAPVWNDIQVNPTSRSSNLKWDPYICANATKMEVWRRVDQFAFTPPECVTGMPEFLGFTKIAEVPITQSTYTDTNGGKGLAVGAQYCYRLVAVFPQPGGGESYVSKDTCLAPILADAPVITNVTIDRTDVADGQITVRWRSPFDVDKLQFPPPYSYEVYRAEGISGNIKLTKAHPGLLTDSTFVDSDSGLNTEELIYNYRVVVYDANNLQDAFDTSSVASTVRLETKPDLQRIELAWMADVPWNNRTQDFPMHYIYRGPSGANESQMELIDSVNVNQMGFKYADEGQFNGQPLLETETYCYRIQTRGAYGNPKIHEPLINFSEIMCAQPNDNQAPCKPELAITGVGCEDYFQNAGCGSNVFSNTLTWNRPADAACRADIRSYNIYMTSRVGGDYVLYRENVRDTFFVDSNENLKSFARCYKLSAVDRSGNESELSTEYCFDNCPYYELPNVFTPNDDKCNELFSAFSDRVLIDENGAGPCGPVDVSGLKARCARFVLSVNFKVYNRWGKDVYTYSSGGEKTIYIDWDGRDNQGHELSTGVYYYIAELVYDVVNPAEERQIVKGWVQLIR